MFGSLFGNKNEKKQLNWTKLIDISQLNEIEVASNTRPVVIFKHSTRCGISRMVLNQFEANADFDEEAIDLYYLDLLRYREISNAIAERFGVYHQSPQMLIIKNGQVVHHSSHSDIVPSTIHQFLEPHQG